MFEVDIDVGRLIAFVGYESFEQQMQARRIHLGNVQAITHRRIGRRTAALTQNTFAARVFDDVVDGDEEILVLQPADQFEFGFDQRSDVFRDTIRPASRGAGQRDLTQEFTRRQMWRHQFYRIFVAQFIERKTTSLEQRHRFLQHLGRIQRAQPGDRAQVMFAVRMQRGSQRCDRRLQTNRS